MKKHIEAEKGELIIVSDEGHRAIIPAKDRKYFLDSLNGCDDCINKYIQQLPMMSNYAEDGSLVPDDGDPIKKETYEQWGDRIRKMSPNLDYTKDGDYNYRGAYEAGLEPVEVDNNGVKEYHLGSRNPKTGEILKYRSHPTFNQAISEDVKMGYVPYEKDGRIYTVDRKSKEYKDLYDSGKLLGYDRGNDLYIAPDLGGATIKATKPQWMKDKEALEKEYSKDWYIDNNLPKFSRSMGVSPNNMGGNQKGYDEYINNKLAESILKRNPNFDKDYSNNRLKTLSNYSQKELEIIKNSNLSYKVEPSIWSKFEQGVLSVGNAGSPVTFKNENLTQKEAKKEDNPLNILQTLSVPSKMVQSAYKDDYSFTDALKGKQNNAGIVEDIVTDPLNLIGLGIWGKLSKANRFKNLDEAYQSVKGLSKEEQLSRLNTLVKETPKNIDYNPSNNLILKSIEEGSPLEKSLSKNGEININTLQAHINNNATSKADKYILQKVVDSHFQNKTSINYNELKNKISDELVELNKTDLPRGNFENYGLDRIGFPNNTSASFTGKVPQHYQDIYNNINNSSTFYKGHDNKYWFDKLSMDKGFDTKEEAVKWLESQMAHNKQMNKTIIFSNEEKFGRGGSDHFDENTLGHSRVFVSPEEPDVFHILESQSDFYQKSPLDKAQKNVKARQNILDEAINDVESKEIFGEDYDRLILDSHKMKLSEANYELKQAQKIMHDNPNPVQKILLGDKHQERLLQENLDYAAKNGQSKLRYPTPETAAKIQGYKKLQREVPIVGENELAPPPELIDMNTNTYYFNGNDYLPEHKTILKKYSEYPKMVKKTLGLNVKEVKDVKGNTWYELDIPKSFKDRTGKIKALSTLPLGIGLQQYLQNQNKSEQ